MILNAIAAELKRRSKDDFKGRHFETSLVDAVDSVKKAIYFCRTPPLG